MSWMLRRVPGAAALGMAVGAALAATWWLGGRLESPKLVVAPAEIDFGRILVGEDRDAMVIATNVGSEPLELLQVSAETPFATRYASVPIAPGESRALKVRFAPSDRGESRATLLVEYDAGEPIAVPLSGHAVVPARMAVEPRFLFFGAVQVGTTGRGLLSIVNEGDEVLEIGRIEARGSFEVEVASVEVPPRSSADLEVRYRPTAVGDTGGLLLIEGNDGRAAVPLKGEGTGRRPRVAIDVSPDSLDFGSVPVGERSELSLTITNVGEDVLRLVRVTTGDEDFASADGTRQIRPGGVITLPVGFAPQSAGARYTPLVVYSNDPDRDPLVVMLEGEGVTGGSGAVQKGAEGQRVARAPDTGGSGGGRTAGGAGGGGSRSGGSGDAPDPTSGSDSDAPSDAAPALPTDPSGLDVDVAAAPDDFVDPLDVLNGFTASPIADGGVVQIEAEPIGLLEQDFEGASFDPATGKLDLGSVLLPTPEFAFGEIFDFSESTGAGVFDQNGDVVITLPLSYTNRWGESFEVPLELTTGTADALDRARNTVVLEGSPLIDGQASLVAVLQIPEGNLSGQVLKVRINVQAP